MDLVTLILMFLAGSLVFGMFFLITDSLDKI